MKRCCRVLAILLALSFVLIGCNQPEVADQTVVCGELTLTLPGNYVNLGEEAYATDVDFLYGRGDEAVLGIKQDRLALETYFPEIDAFTFAEMFVEKAELDVTVEQTEDLVFFVYTANAGGTQVTYLSGVFMTEQNFWVLQFYCPSEDFSARNAAFMGYLASVRA